MFVKRFDAFVKYIKRIYNSIKSIIFKNNISNQQLLKRLCNQKQQFLNLQ